MKRFFVIIIAVIFAGMLFQGVFAICENGNIINMKDDIIITAHRGGAGYGPENTIQAISRSLTSNVKSIEIDVHCSKDGKIIVCHDRSINRTTNGKGVIGRLTKEELEKYLIVDNNGILTSEQLPELWQVLELVNGQAELLIEIKRTGNDNPNIEYLVVNAIHDYKAHSWAVIQSFNDNVLETVHSIDPTIRLEKLLFCKLGALPIIYDGAFTRFSLEKYHYIESFNIYHKGLSYSFANLIHNNGKSIRIWTINKLKQIPSYEFDGIITDYPDLFLDYLTE